MKVFFSTPCGDKLPLDLDEDATVETLRRAILIENERREALEEIDPRHRRCVEEEDIALPHMELFIGTCKLEDSQLISDYALRTEGEIVVHPCWAANRGETVDSDGQMAAQWVRNLAFVDPDWWFECGEQMRENWRVRAISIKRHWDEGELWNSVTRVGSSPYWPFDYRDRAALNTDERGV